MSSMTDEATAHEPPHRREVRFRHGDVALAGALYTPATAGLHPAMIMIQGSGSADRDNFGYFPPIRAHIVRHGIAVLCFDKPGTGDSSGDWRAQSLQDRADEALAAVGCLRGQDDIAPGRVGLWGFSQGGWVTPLAASLSRDIAFIIPVSGPGVSPAEQNAYDIAHNMRADGLPEEQIARGVAYVEALMDAARRKDSYERVEHAVLRAARAAPWYRYFEIPDAALWDFFLRGDPDYDPVPALERVRCPVLAIFGECDRQLPARVSAEIFERALRRGGNPDVTVRVFPAANHGIAIADPVGLAPGYLDLMTDWLRERVGGARA